METLLLRPIGNSQGLVLPQRLLKQVGVKGGAAFIAEVIDGKIVLERKRAVREGWAAAAAAAAAVGGDELELGDFDNEADEAHTW